MTSRYIIGWCLVGTHATMCTAPIPGAAPFGRRPPGQGRTRNFCMSTPLPVALIVFQVVPIRILAQWVSPYDLLQNRYVDLTHMGLNMNLAEKNIWESILRVH